MKSQEIPVYKWNSISIHTDDNLRVNEYFFISSDFLLSSTKPSVNEYVRHKYRTWLGKLKVKSITFDMYELEAEDGKLHFYDLGDIISWGESNVFKDDDPLYCGCSTPDIVESSIQVHRGMDAHEKFKYCRNCKREKK